MREKKVQTTPPVPTKSAVGPCPTLIQISRTPGTGSLASAIAPPDHPLYFRNPKGVRAIEVRLYLIYSRLLLSETLISHILYYRLLYI